MTPHSPVHRAILANLAVIRQGLSLLPGLGEARYTARLPVFYNASVGGHLRHIIEHYQGFLRGLEVGRIDYEDRPRNLLIEGSLEHAATIMAEIADQLQALAATLPNRVLPLCAETTAGAITDTSVLRELEFLLSHTIHHYALIAVMARLQGYEPEATFGVAPSTIKFQQSQAVCAR